MLDSSSSVTYAPRKFEETSVFKSLVASAAKSMDIPLMQLASKGYVSSKTVQLVAKNKITTLGDLLSSPLVGAEIADVRSTRMEIIDKLLGGKKH